VAVSLQSGISVLHRVGCLILVVAGTLLLTGCASSDPRFAPRYGEHRIGDLTVLVLDAGTVNLACQMRSPRPRVRYEGCYIPREQTIISNNDVGVLLHELKHALESDWKH